MVAEQILWLDNDLAWNGGARSIGSVLNGLREVAMLRDRRTQTATSATSAALSRPAQPRRLRALRRNSA